MNGETAAVEKPGKIFPARTMFFREQVGEASDPSDGNSYTMDTNVSGGAPIIRSKQTGKWFVLSWADIIGLAREAGIDDG